MNPYKAVVFDFDGVIGDTMQDNYQAWKASFEAFGVLVEPLEYFLLEGMGRYEIARTLSEKYGLSEDLEKQLVEAKEANYKARNQFRIYPEIPLILKQLLELEIQIALVTGASRMRISDTLPKDLMPHFTAIVTADDVKKGKPDPEPYLAAIKKLNLQSGDCLVIENAILGVKAAKSAGCACFALETTVSSDYLHEADLVFGNHHALLAHFLKLFSK
jgi:HAD superfamily hydrolase (TIGR01509 family)